MYNKPYLGQIPKLRDFYMETFGYITDGYFVDIGAFDCQQWSNTFVLAEAGWSGIMVEPQPVYADACRQTLNGFDNVAIIEAAAADRDGIEQLRLAGSLSTINEEQVERYKQTKEFSIYFSESEFIPVEVINVDRLFREQEVPAGFEVLSLDVEGSEMDVLNGMDIEFYQPRLAIVEAHEGWGYDHMGDFADSINNYFIRAGYEKIYSDHINNIYRSGE